jgi:hypothetical protein
MWSDNETETDLLDFSHLMAVIQSVIGNRELLPTTIGVFGDWGSGKSSLIKMVCTKVAAAHDNKVLCISFNGWLFEGYQDAKTAMMSTILEEIAKKRNLTANAENLLGKLFKKVNLMRLALLVSKGVAGYAIHGEFGMALALLSDLPELAKKLAEKWEGVSSDEIEKLLRDMTATDQKLHVLIQEFHRDFEKFLAETNIETLVVFIDDLDRCTPDTIIGTLEAIKLFLFAPQTVFVLGADERLVQHAVRRRFPELPGDRADVGRDYLEKLIQFPVRIPPLGRVEFEIYLNLLFIKLANLTDEQYEKLRKAALNRSPEHLYDMTFTSDVVEDVLDDVPPELREYLALAGYLAPILTAGLSGNPRQAKRFLNTLIMRKTMAESKNVTLKLRVLAKLMLLEYFRPEFFQQLAAVQAEQNGVPKELRLMEGQFGGNETLDSQTEIEAHRSPAHPESISSSEDGRRAALPQVDSDVEQKEEAALEDAEVDADQDLLVTTWLADDWIKNWLVTQPLLSGQDLRPYFYFSRDRLGTITTGIQRLSPLARAMLAKLTSPTDTRRRQVRNQLKQLSDVDATNMFKELAERVRQSEDLSDEKSPLFSLFDLVEVRIELRGQLLALLSQLAESALPVSIVPRLIRLTQEDQTLTKLSTNILNRWVQGSSNRPLATASKQALERATKESRNEKQ